MGVAVAEAVGRRVSRPDRTRELRTAVVALSLQLYRRMEARGEIRGGRFVAGVGGEQFALPDAVEKLRRVRDQKPARSMALALGRRSAEPHRHRASRSALACDGRQLAGAVRRSDRRRRAKPAKCGSSSKLDAKQTDELLSKFKRTG